MSYRASGKSYRTMQELVHAIDEGAAVWTAVALIAVVALGAFAGWGAWWWFRPR